MQPNETLPVVNIKPKITPKDHWHSMKMATIEIIYVWSIPNITTTTNDDFFSPRFCAEGYESTIWEMVLHKDTEQVFIKLMLNSSDMKKVQATHEFSILNNEGQSVHHLNMIENRRFQTECDHVFTRFIKTKTLFNSDSGLLVDDTLSIKCVVQFTSYHPSILQTPKFNEIKISEHKLSEHLEQLVANDKFSDAVLVVGGKELPVHKHILSVRSKVFAAMFEHDMEEKRQNRVVIPDIDYEVFKEMLHFLYTGKAPNLEDMMFELFVAADMYDVEKLKLMCEKKIFDNITVENSSEILELTEVFNTCALKARVLRYLEQKTAEETFLAKIARV